MSKMTKLKKRENPKGDVVRRKLSLSGESERRRPTGTRPSTYDL
jgi:hypothetical protein